MKKSFTLIEVLLSVMILLISSTIFISVSQNTKHLLKILLSQKDKIVYSSTMINSKTKNLYEDLVNFKIDNDEIIKSLKGQSTIIKNKKIQKDLIEIEVNNIKYYKIK